MRESTEQKRKRLTRNLIVKLEEASLRLDEAIDWVQDGHGFSLTSGPHAVMDILMGAQNDAIRLECIGKPSSSGEETR